jgi:Ras-related protein Rab-7A
MFDVNEPDTLEALTKWWDEFRESAPLADEDMEDYCCVVVGNKIDMVGSGNGNGPVTEAEALRFLDVLVPPPSRPPSPIRVLPFEARRDDAVEEDDEDDPMASSQLTVRALPHIEFPAPNHPRRSSSNSPTPSPPRTHSSSIAIIPSPNAVPHSPSHSPKHRVIKPRSRSSSRLYGGTMTTTHTTLTIYHTPSSSLFDVYQSARTSPEPWSSPGSSPSPNSSYRASRRMPSLSSASTSSGSAVTMTPSLFAREQTNARNTASTTPEDDPFALTAAPPPPERGPKLFFTSAKTGAGVSAVFEYIAQRVVKRGEYEERAEARRLHVREASAADTIRLGLEGGKRRKGGGRWAECCGS